MKVLSLVSLLFAFNLSVAQNPNGVAPAVSTFTSQPDLVGSSKSSVNLYNGEVAFSLPLASAASPTGLNASISISYSTLGLNNSVKTWNLDAPTSCVGLGWNFSFPKIIADHKSTGTIIDDDYYLSDGASTTELIRIGSGTDSKGMFYTYELKNNPFWQIKFYSELSSINKERWEIISSDGTIYVYGDANSNRETVQRIPRWDNWIGNSIVTTGRDLMAISWNLSEISNQWGQKLIYEYLDYGHSSLLKKITNPEGIKIELNYSLKLNDWFQEPYTQFSEPDGYQEFYEKHFLDFIEVKNENNILIKKVDLSYSTLEYSSSIKKMILTSIAEIAPNGNRLNPYTFQYYQSLFSMFAGYLWKITNPLGGTAEFNYKHNSILNASNKLQINAPSGFSEPKTWIGNDYVLVAWRKLVNDSHSDLPQEVKLKLYEWVGGWKEFDLGSINNVKLEGEEGKKDYKNFKVVTGRSFLAIQHITDEWQNRIQIFTKKKLINNEVFDWQKEEFISTLNVNTDLRQSVFSSGENFILAGYYKGSPCERFTFNGLHWQQEFLNNFTGHLIYSTGHNYFLVHDEAANPDRIYFNFLDAERNWNFREINSSLTFASSGLSFWHSGASLAVVMAKNNPEFIYRWSKDYNTFYKDDKNKLGQDLFGMINDDIPVYIAANTLVGMGGKVARFDGQGWHSRSMTMYSDVNGQYYFFGDDLVVFNEDATTGKRLEFRPALNTWASIATMNGTFNRTSTGFNCYIHEGKLYFKKPNGTWEITQQNLQTSYFFPIAFGIQSFILIPTIVPYQSPYSDLTIIKQINGQTRLSTLYNQPLLLNNSNFKNQGASNEILITREFNTIPLISQAMDATTLNLYKFLEGYVQGDNVIFSEIFTDRFVSKVITSDGTNQNPKITSYIFKTENATVDQQGLSAIYSEVDIVDNLESSGERPKGYTRSYTFNRINSNNSLLYGVTYRTEVFDKNESLISYSLSQYKNNNTILYGNSNSIKGYGIWLNKEKETQFLNGITKSTKYWYNSSNGEILETENCTETVNGKSDIILTSFKYAHEFYTSLTTKNLLNLPLVTEVYSNKSGLIASTIKTLKFWGSNQIPMLHRSYIWDGYESSEFNAWNEGTNPHAQWRLTSRVDDVDLTTGLLKETTNTIGIKNATLWDYPRKLPLAVVSGASQNQFTYNGFENLSSNFSNEAYSGTKSSTSIFNVVLPSSGTYTLSWWQKQGQNNWQYVEQIVSANTAIGGNGLLIDEVRLLPQHADMTTYSYDNRGNKISECDANNNCMHYEYDEFNRVKTIRDSKRNILEHKVYQLD